MSVLFNITKKGLVRMLDHRAWERALLRSRADDEEDSYGEIDKFGRFARQSPRLPMLESTGLYGDAYASPFGAGTMYFPGGADISPELYGEKNNGQSHPVKYCDERDLERYEAAKKRNLVCVGICRGAQFLWAMSGGKLMQHIKNNHKFEHHVNLLDIRVNSLHHQGIIGKVPSGLEVKATHEGVVEAFIGLNKDGLRCVAVQWHPEMLEDGVPARDWFIGQVAEVVKCKS